ncbi:transketolase [Metamycoplasma auris]|uniref:Transketolase n=1 Tax=Metamycoplasma auris TaxID=51363 RepID=A0A2W7G4B4_9BACT|nr:transketolase [Metamycoplasma auris]PZW01422.1 transketolase [Metamycoplasma auris]
MFKNRQINNLAIDNIKINSLAQIANTRTANIAINISAAKIFHSLFAFHYKFDLQNPNWISRDRFILSDADAIPTYYSTLYILGLLKKTDIENIGKSNSQFQNYIEKNNNLGIEVSSTKAGYGIAKAVGIALSEAHLSKEFKEISHYTYVFVSNKDLDTGIAHEALRYAGSINLNKLIILYDSNSFLGNGTNKKNLVNSKKMYQSYGFKYLKINDASYKSITKAILKAKRSSKPTIIEIKTSLQEMGINNFQSFQSQNYSLTFEQIDDIRDNTHFKKSDPFDTYIDVINEYKKVYEKNNLIFKKWTQTNKLINYLTEEIKENVNDNYLKDRNDLSSKLITVIDNILDKYKNTIVLSSSLDLLKKMKNSNGVFDYNNTIGRSLFLDTKKMSMGLIANGISLHSNLIPITFDNLSDADLFIPSIRQAITYNKKILYIFNNNLNSIQNSNIKYQEEEQMALLNQIEGLKILYPADITELKGALEYFFNKNKGPVVIVSKLDSNWSCEETSKYNFIGGAYFLLNNHSEFTLLAKGNDLYLAHKIATKHNFNLISISNEDNIDKLEYDRNKAITFTKDTKHYYRKYAKYNLNINNSNDKLRSDFNYIEKAIKAIFKKSSQN